MENYKIKHYEMWRELPPALTNDETMRLIREYKETGDIEVRNRIVEGNLRFVSYYLYRYCTKSINSITSIYPSFDDLVQEGSIVLMKCLERFKLDYNFTFGTFMAKGLKNMHLMNFRRANMKKNKAVVVSLDEKVKDKNGDDNGLTVGDSVADEKYDDDFFTDKIEVDFIKKEILPMLSKKERDMFVDHYFHEMTNEQIGEKFDYTQPYISRQLSAIKEKIRSLYLNGVTDLDKLLKGVDLGYRLPRFVKVHGVVAKYGRSFLENYFLPTLPRKQKLIFEYGVLKYRGQNDKELEEEIGVKATSIQLDAVLKKLDEDAPRLLQLQAEGKLPKPRKLNKHTQFKINKNKRLLEQYGGRLFLAKYFLRTLPDVEQRIFMVAMLDYSGESLEEISKKTKVSVANVATRQNKILKKLEETDFEALVDLVDNSLQYGTNLSSVDLKKMDKLKSRFAIVEQYGGKARLQKLFLPILPESQKRVFEDMYLTPKYDSFDSMSKAVGVKTSCLIVAEKAALEKLKSTNLKELETLQARAEEEIYFEQIDARRKRKGNKTKMVEKSGGVEFLKENFMPTLEIKAHRIVFEKYFLQGSGIREVLNALGLKSKSYDYVKRTITELTSKLIWFKSKFEDLDQAVKDFYTRKEFEKAHPEDFEATALGEEKKQEQIVEPEIEIAIKNVGKCELSEKRQEFMDEFLKQFGEKKEIVRSFMPSLKSIVRQQVFLGTFLECKMDVEVAQEYGLSLMTIKNEKQSIVKELEEFGKTQQEIKKKTAKKESKNLIR